MQIIGNTYVGGNPAQQQLSQSGENAANRIASSFALKRQQQATANENIRAEEERRAKEAFLSLDEQLKALLSSEQGSNVFEEGPDNPYYKDAQRLLLGAGDAYARAYGGDPGAYISAFTKRPLSTAQHIAADRLSGNLKGNNQRVGGGSSAGDNDELYKGYSGQKVSYQGSGAAAPAGDFTPVADKSTLITPAMLKGGTAYPPVRPQGDMNPAASTEPLAIQGTAVAPAAAMDFDAMMTKVRNEQRADDKQKKILAEEKRQADLREKVGQRLGISPTQVLQAEAAVRQDASAIDAMRRDIQKNPAEAKAMYEFALKSLEDPASQMGEQHLRFKALYEAAMNKILIPSTGSVRLPPAYDTEGANRIPRVDTLPENRARGTGRPQMSPAELARHEATTGDYHYPALIGVKEGVVNARAMENGGDEVVRMLNEGYPAYPQGKAMGQMDEPDVPVENVPQTPGQAPWELAQAQYAMAQGGLRAAGPTAYEGQEYASNVVRPENVTGGYSEVRTDDQGYTPVGRQTTPAQSYTPPGDKASLVDMISAMVQDNTAKGAKGAKSAIKTAGRAVNTYAPKIAALVGQKAEAIALGNMPKAQAVTTRLLEEERRAITAHLADPAYRKHNEKVREALRQFMETADDTQLAYYGFDNVLKSKQDVRKFEEEKAVNAATRLYQTRMADNAVKNTAYVDAQTALVREQIKKTAAEESYFTARAKAIANDPSVFNMEETVKQLQEWAKVYKTPEELDKFIQSNTTVKKAFDNYAIALSGPGSTWATVSKRPGIFADVARFFGFNPTVTSGVPAAKPVQQGSGKSQEVIDFETKYGL